MARTYNNKRSSRQKGGAPQQFLMIIVTFLLGYLTASLFDIGTVSHWVNTQVLAHQEQKAQPKVAAQQSQVPPKPKFEFYTLLANEKAGGAQQTNANTAANHPAKSNINAAQATAAATHAVTTHTTATTTLPMPIKNTKATNSTVVAKNTTAKPAVAAFVTKGNYLVQVASFKARQDAEHMKGALILKGFNVNVVPIIKDGGNWFRVVVGPYSNRDLAQKAQSNLAKNERLRGMVLNMGA